MDSIISLCQKNTLAEYMILSGAENRPPMLDKDMYDSWKSRMELYMKKREHVLESVEHGPLICPKVEANGVIRTKKYAELFAAKKIQADCDMKATNIILQGLPADMYSLLNHHRVAKDLWERVQLLMQDTSLTKQERECKLYDAFDKFTHIKGESLHTYYLIFTQLINDMNIYKMNMEQFQVNTKFLNSLPHEWSKFVTDVKLVKDLHTSNYDQLHAYLEQHELHANESQINHQTSSIPQVSYQSPPPTAQHMNEWPFVDSGFAVPVFSLRDDLIVCLNKAMAFLTVVASSRQMLLNATIVKVNGIWLDNAHSLSDQRMLHGIPASQAQTIIPHNAAFQNEDLDTYDSNCDDLSNAQAILMAKISNYGSEVISEVPHSKTYLNDMNSQSVHALHNFKQSPVIFTDSEISSDSNIILYSQYLQETQKATVQDTNLQAQQDSMILSVIEQMLEQMINYVNN
nr:retrovirus-related Pol polyprotein from transposon TNT 1-94 [Tanacetum cinerariifolium]